MFAGFVLTARKSSLSVEMDRNSPNFAINSVNLMIRNLSVFEETDKSSHSVASLTTYQIIKIQGVWLPPRIQLNLSQPLMCPFLISSV